MSYEDVTKTELVGRLPTATTTLNRLLDMASHLGLRVDLHTIDIASFGDSVPCQIVSMEVYDQVGRI